jgi:hypothetical protein
MTLVATAISRRKQTSPAMRASIAVMNRPAIVLGSSTWKLGADEESGDDQADQQVAYRTQRDRPVNQPGTAGERNHRRSAPAP